MDLDCDITDTNILIISSGWAPPRPSIALKLTEGNILYPINLLSRLDRIFFKHVIYLSTISVYGTVKESVITESTPYMDPSLYGASKLIGEKIFLESEKFSNVFVLRLPGVIGPGVKNAWIHKTFERICNSEDIELVSVNSNFNNVVSTYDIANFIIHISLKDFSGPVKEVFNFCSSSPVSIREVINSMVKNLNSRSVVREISAEESFSIDNSKLIKQTGFIPSKVIDVINDQLYARYKTGR